MNTITNYFQSPIKENVDNQIIENMKFVIKSSKKKRKRNKKSDNNESVISDIVATLTNNLHFETANNNLSVAGFENSEEKCSPEVEKATEDTAQNKVSKNVFEVMMDARNRVIGSNSNGIETEPDVPSNETTPTSVKHKRKILLEKWCEEKGKKERELKEQAETDYINDKMAKRAERLKKIITQNSTESGTNDENNKDGEKRKKKTKAMAKKKLNLEEVEVEVENEVMSPSKKRDILGYFQKLNGSLEEKNENIRPRRSCAKNKSYLFDMSPTKEPCVESQASTKGSSQKSNKRSLNTTSPKRVKSKKQKLDSDDDVEITSSTIAKPKKTKSESKNVKLAPLFVKQVPRPAIDPEVLKARQKFLMSGIPESLRLDMARQKAYSDEYDMNYNCFPVISHITQLNLPTNEIPNAICKIQWQESCRDDDELFAIEKYDRLKLGVITDCDRNAVCLAHKPNDVYGSHAIDKIPKKHLITLIKSLRTDYNNYPVYRCYKQLKFKCKQVAMEMIQANDDVQIVNNESFKNGYQLFNEMYKPKCLNEIYINYRQGVELKRFLSNWQENYYSHKCSEEDDSMSYSESNSNFVVLVGPHGCGKTNSVYAMAHEMNFKVLEINCGSKRTGKRMLQKLHEATQSHNVHKHNKNFSQKTDDTNSRSDTDTNSKKLALILIEDSDIVFEQDDGFINAINQLISTSKRPVILVSNNPFSNHLLKLIEHNSITYDEPSLVNVAKYLSLLGLVEHYFLDYGELGKLIKFNHNDLRRTINMVQFFIQSGGDRETGSSRATPNKPKPCTNSKLTDTFGCSEMLDVQDDNSKFSWCDSDNDDQPTTNRKLSTVHRHSKIFEYFVRNQNCLAKFEFYGNFNTLWLNVPAILLEPHRKVKAKKRNSHADEIKTIDTLNEIGNFFDNISIALVLDFEKGHQDYSFACDLSKEIVSTLVESSMAISNVDYKKYDLLLNHSNESGDLLYNGLSTTLGGSSYIRKTVASPSVALDYEPYLRAMCRIEQDRQQSSDRRNSRFYHYLRNCINTCSFGTEYFDKHANILNDQLN